MRVTPDGARYLRMGAGMLEPAPFHYRWLLPKLLGPHILRWAVALWLSIAACAALIALCTIQRGGTHRQAITAAALWLGLPVVRFLVAAPVLVDAFGMALMLGSVVAWPSLPWLAAALLVLAASTWEKAPIFAAAFAWEPLFLTALVVPIARRVLVAPGAIRDADPLSATLRHPLATGLHSHAGVWRDPLALLLPWGACLAALGDLDVRWILPVALAYSQLALATDTTRLFQQAAPVVCIAAAFVIPAEWVVPILVAHWFNPWAGSGL